MGENNHVKRINHATEENAIEALEYYESLLMRSLDVIYVAVVKENSCYHECYKLEIAVSSDRVDFDSSITPTMAINRDFKEHQIPIDLPIPSQFMQAVYNKEHIIDSSESFYTYGSIIVEKIKLDEEESLKTSKSFYDSYSKNKRSNNLSLKNWLKIPYGSQPIYSDKSEGTLGGCFTLKEFPDKILGITTWHSFSNNEVLGEKIYLDESNLIEIGKSFWKKINLFYEVGFIELDIKVIDKIFSKCINKSKWRIGKPKIGAVVKRQGYGSYIAMKGVKQSNIFEIPKIFSTNATVRVYQNNYENQHKIFKNQILIQDLSTDGDSGAILVSENKNKTKQKAIGIMFSNLGVFEPGGNVNTYKRVTVASNLKKIFSEIKQEVFIEKNDLGIKTRLLNNFKIKNNQFH